MPERTPNSPVRVGQGPVLPRRRVVAWWIPRASNMIPTPVTVNARME